jgi:hypothetical protein
MFKVEDCAYGPTRFGRDANGYQRAVREEVRMYIGVGTVLLILLIILLIYLIA